jgi:uncharacterized protein YqhQ
MKIIHGQSLPNSIRFSTATHTAIARYNAKGGVAITCTLSKLGFRAFLSELGLVILVGTTCVCSELLLSMVTDASEVICSSAVLILTAILMWKVAPWHGAEHKAASAFDRINGPLTDIEYVRQYSRIHDMCGSRVLLPGLCIILLGFFLRSTAFVGVSFLGLILFDRYIGLLRVPGILRAFRFIQKHLTTREPTDLQLITAMAAINVLWHLEKRGPGG